MNQANVETFIVFRSLTPLLLALAYTNLRRQPCPSKLTFMSLLIIFGGTIEYVATDSAFTLVAYYGRLRIWLPSLLKRFTLSIWYEGLANAWAVEARGKHGAQRWRRTVSETLKRPSKLNKTLWIYRTNIKVHYYALLNREH
ncbi:hypothetical protein J1N35_015309 [Gossypium stocksii]|uniref:Sugar phosphate transporter domain-containing protein n=1 Tax=Gossypium stocksii TaxID=47602 RepID=A0A9D4A8G3_9ROSI|nr:hypothetical protein J1N35_015309 [Gossypium stocksii]